MRRALLLAAALAAPTPIAACSSDNSNDAASADNTITVQMTDNAYSPTEFDVRKGDTVTFEFVNDGRMTHEAYLGSEQAQDDHAAEMMGGDGAHSMDMGGGDVMTVEPGKSRTMTHTFDDAGTVLIACHQPGHWESGMKATVNVG